MRNELQWLRQKIESLADEVGESRGRLLNCLDVAERHPTDALGLARATAESLAKQVLAAIGAKPSATLDSCLRELEKPETMSRALVPAEIITMLHKVRVIGNKALHDDLRIAVTTDDVTSALGDVLRVVRWYFGEFARGPRLDPVFRQAAAVPGPAAPAVRSSAVALLDACLDRHDSPYEQAVEKGRKVIRPRHSAGERRYAFPTVDFKLLNSGDAFAFLWKFVIRVSAAEVDRTPVLSFSSRVEGGVLEVRVVNNGWGAAADCQFRLREPTLDNVFRRPLLRYEGAVASGESLAVCRLTKDAAIPGRWESLLVGSRDGECVLRGGRVEWECTDEDGGQKYQGDSEVPFGGSGSRIVLTPSHFAEIGSEGLASLVGSDVTYAALIDPSQGGHKREYSISHKIPPGDVERFHVLIGSRASCRLLLRFQFFIDRDVVLESDEFEVHVWNPRDWRRPIFEDGSELPREVDRLERQAETGRLDPRAASKAAELRGRAATFPLVPPSQEENREAIVRALRQGGPAGREIFAALVAQLQEPSRFVRLETIQVLGRAGSLVGEAAPALLAVVAAGDDDLTLHAFEALERVAPERAREGAPRLLRILSSDDDGLLWHAFEALARAAPEALSRTEARSAVPALVRRLRRDAGGQMLQALIRLGHASTAAPSLAGAVLPWPHGARRQALEALAAASGMSLALLIAAGLAEGGLPGDRPLYETRSDLLALTELIGPQDAAAVPALAAALAQPAPVCWWAVLALGAIGPAAQAAVPALQQFQGREPNMSVRLDATIALGKIQE
jgi:hypothetical protein